MLQRIKQLPQWISGLLSKDGVRYKVECPVGHIGSLKRGEILALGGYEPQMNLIDWEISKEDRIFLVDCSDCPHPYCVAVMASMASRATSFPGEYL